MHSPLEGDKKTPLEGSKDATVHSEEESNEEGKEGDNYQEKEDERENARVAIVERPASPTSVLPFSVSFPATEAGTSNDSHQTDIEVISNILASLASPSAKASPPKSHTSQIIERSRTHSQSSMTSARSMLGSPQNAGILPRGGRMQPVAPKTQTAMDRIRLLTAKQGVNVSHYSKIGCLPTPPSPSVEQARSSIVRWGMEVPRFSDSRRTLTPHSRGASPLHSSRKAVDGSHSPYKSLALSMIRGSTALSLKQDEVESPSCSLGLPLARRIERPTLPVFDEYAAGRDVALPRADDVRDVPHTTVRDKRTNTVGSAVTMQRRKRSQKCKVSRTCSRDRITTTWGVGHPERWLGEVTLLFSVGYGDIVAVSAVCGSWVGVADLPNPHHTFDVSVAFLVWKRAVIATKRKSRPRRLLFRAFMSWTRIVPTTPAGSHRCGPLIAVELDENVAIANTFDCERRPTRQQSRHRVDRRAPTNRWRNMDFDQCGLVLLRPSRFRKKRLHEMAHMAASQDAAFYFEIVQLYEVPAWATAPIPACAILKRNACPLLNHFKQQRGVWGPSLKLEAVLLSHVGAENSWPLPQDLMARVDITKMRAKLLKDVAEQRILDARRALHRENRFLEDLCYDLVVKINTLAIAYPGRLVSGLYQQILKKDTLKSWAHDVKTCDMHSECGADEEFVYTLTRLWNAMLWCVDGLPQSPPRAASPNRRVSHLPRRIE